MLEKIKNYFKKEFKSVIEKPKTIKNKWWFWFIVISCIFGIFSDNSQNNTNTVTSSNISQNEVVENTIKEETEEEKQAREEQERKQAEEKALEKAKKERQKRIDNNSLNAYVYTEKIVKDNLKAPSTAKFSNQKYGYNEEYSRYVTSGSVDSQNSFGAMIRANFYAEYDQDVNLIYFVFDNQVLLDKR